MGWSSCQAFAVAAGSALLSAGGRAPSPLHTEAGLAPKVSPSALPIALLGDVEGERSRALIKASRLSGSPPVGGLLVGRAPREASEVEPGQYPSGDFRPGVGDDELLRGRVPEEMAQTVGDDFIAPLDTLLEA